MGEKRSEKDFSKLRVVIYLSFLIFSIFNLASGQELINCLVATVDRDPVSLFDLKVIESFQLLAGFGPGVYKSRIELAERYIDEILVLSLAKEQIRVSREEMDKELARLKSELGSGVFEEKCQALGLKEENLLPYLQNKLLFERIVGSRFNQKFYISLKEIEEYYQKVYVPEENARGVKPAELVNVLDEIEARLEQQRREQQINEWTRELRQRVDITIYPDCLKRAEEKER
jgi:hypothetical protein